MSGEILSSRLKVLESFNIGLSKHFSFAHYSVLEYSQAFVGTQNISDEIPNKEINTAIITFITD